MPASRERSYRLEVIVLREYDWGEADRILTVFSREQGKLRLLAKGVRKIRSRKAGHLLPFTQSQLQVAAGREMPIITQAETIQAFASLRENLTLIGYTSYVIELLDRFTYEEGEHLSLYRLLLNTLQRLSHPDLDPLITLRYYEIRLLDAVGFRPQLTECAACNRPIQPEDQYFSNTLGGVICPRCAPQHDNLRPISVNALKYLRHFQRSPYEQAQIAAPTPAIHNEMEKLMQAYLTHLLERALNTPNFLRRIRPNP
ncbi:MAG: DNA repair protein RecO [Anaerolineales bacterium]